MKDLSKLSIKVELSIKSPPLILNNPIILMVLTLLALGVKLISPKLIVLVSPALICCVTDLIVNLPLMVTCISNVLALIAELLVIVTFGLTLSIQKFKRVPPSLWSNKRFV